MKQEYAARARELCDEAGALLIFDEIMTGFRHSLHGAEAYLSVRPDLSAFGKAVSNGHVLAMFAGADVLMSELGPTGPVFYSGTFNGQNLGVAAALATLEMLRDPETLPRIHRMTKTLAEGVSALIVKSGVTAACQYFGGVWCRVSARRGRNGKGPGEVHNAREQPRERGISPVDAGPRVLRSSAICQPRVRDGGPHRSGHRRHIGRGRIVPQLEPDGAPGVRAG